MEAIGRRGRPETFAEDGRLGSSHDRLVGRCRERFDKRTPTRVEFGHYIVKEEDGRFTGHLSHEAGLGDFQGERSGALLAPGPERALVDTPRADSEIVSMRSNKGGGGGAVPNAGRSKGICRGPTNRGDDRVCVVPTPEIGSVGRVKPVQFHRWHVLGADRRRPRSDVIERGQRGVEASDRPQATGGYYRAGGRGFLVPRIEQRLRERRFLTEPSQQGVSLHDGSLVATQCAEIRTIHLCQGDVKEASSPLAGAGDEIDALG